MKNYPVVVYGASGYTGRLACEFLRSFGIPFVAAGRSRERLEAAMRLVPGIENAAYAIAEVEHDVEALRKLFEGSRVVCNVVGPFLLHGRPVVEAALRANCHYLDTTGEQPFMLEMREAFATDYRRADLLLAPSTAYMHAVLEIACRRCEQHGELDTLEALCVPTGTPTFASTQTIFQTARTKEYYLEGGQLTPWPAAYGADVRVPYTDRTLLGLPWSGMALPVWFEHHPRIRNVRGLTAFTSRELMTQVHSIYKHYHDNLAALPESEQRAELAKIAAGIQPGSPPRENPLVHRNWDTVVGSGSHGRVRYTVYSHCPYQQTGLLQAFAASCLLKQPPQVSGFASPSQAFGSENLLGVLERFGYAKLVREA